MNYTPNLKDIVDNKLFNKDIIGGFEQTDESIKWYLYNKSMY